MTANGDRVRFPDISPTAGASRGPGSTGRAPDARMGSCPAQARRVFGEDHPTTFKANAVRVTDTQYPWVHEHLLTVCDFDVDEPPELYVSQTPLMNAGAVGLDRPIVLNSSTIEVLDQDEIEAVIGHEVGHILSGRTLYRTCCSSCCGSPSPDIRWPGLQLPLLYGLLEWVMPSSPVIALACWPPSSRE